jgi:1-deoxy-D-xylulose-5-phosphate reductoisomerase
MEPAPRQLILLGATGSIGRSTLDLVRRWPERFTLLGASAQRRGQALAELADVYPEAVLSLGDEAARRSLLVARPDLEARMTAPGERGLLELIEGAPVGSLVVNGLVGAAGLRPTVEALRRGLDVALANKEALVVGGELVLEAARESGATLWPVDSEHSAIAQCLRGNPRRELSRIWLTASGGPFRDADPDALGSVSLEQVLDHPTWKMGPKITVDSATMMNKGLEVIEAHHLFQLGYDRIEVVIHRQSIVHSMIEMVDGVFLAQLGAPDMRLPILYALGGGEHWEADLAPFDPVAAGTLQFEAPDPRRYPCLGLARAAGEAGGSAPIVLNAANEELVGGLLRGSLSFGDIPRLIERALESLPLSAISSVEEALERDMQTRRVVREWVAPAAHG